MEEILEHLDFKSIQSNHKKQMKKNLQKQKMGKSDDTNKIFFKINNFELILINQNIILNNF